MRRRTTEVDRIIEFRRTVRNVRFECAVDLQHMHNMDQTMCWFDMPQRYTNDICGVRQVRLKTTGSTKRGFTVAFCCNAVGDKLPAMLIFKERNGVLGPLVVAQLELPPNVILAASISGCMTQHLFIQWLTTVYGVDEQQEEPRRMLLVDLYKVHQTEESKQAIDQLCNAEVV